MKRYLLILLALLFCASAQAAVSVRLEDGAALLDAQGSVILDFGVWEDIVLLGENRFAAQRNGMYALMDETGAALTEAVYGDLRACGALFLACRDGKWGVLQADGSVLADFRYTRLIPGEAGFFWALKTDPDDLNSDALFLLDASGREKSAAFSVRRTAEASGCGLLAVQLSENGLWGFCDQYGNLAVPAEYESVGRFAAGIAPVVKDGCWGAIGTNGNLLIPARYDSLEITGAGSILASGMGEGVQLFSSEGKSISSHTGEGAFAAALGDGYVLYEKESVRIFDAEGNERFTASPDAAVSEGLNGQILISDGPWGEENSYIAGTEPRYRHLYPLGTAGDMPLYACMSVSASRYMNELLGEVQLAVDMDSARWGVADADGNLLLPMEYESIQYIAEGRLLVRMEGQLQLLDLSGNVLWTHGVRQSEAASF